LPITCKVASGPPDNVLARTPDMITWWMRARHELMFFGRVDHEGRGFDGGTYPHPALVFKVTRRELFVRALERVGRNTPENCPILELRFCRPGLPRPNARPR